MEEGGQGETGGRREGKGDGEGKMGTEQTRGKGSSGVGGRRGRERRRGEEDAGKESTRRKVEDVPPLNDCLSQLAKKAGYLTSLSALESYLDPSTSLFNRSLLQSYSEWEQLEPGFRFHGRNVRVSVAPAQA
eukprot:732747-Hanusia_phi.AAC.1